MNTNYQRVAAFTGIVLMLAVTPGWGTQPPANDVSDANNNTGGGAGTLESNTTGFGNTAYGSNGLVSNTSGYLNTAMGAGALDSNTTGYVNTAVGQGALSGSTEGIRNTAVGFNALGASAGSDNIGIGSSAGGNLISGNTNIYLGNRGRATESKTMRLGGSQTRTFVAGIAGTPIINGNQVVINNNGRLGIIASSARYKKDIRDMGERSRKVLELRPVTFRYKQEPQGQPQYGLIAEEVARVYPELVTRTATGEVESVQYHALVPMLLNEMRRQHGQIAELEARMQELAAVKAQNAALADRLAGLEKATARATILTGW